MRVLLLSYFFLQLIMPFVVQSQSTGIRGLGDDMMRYRAKGQSHARAGLYDSATYYYKKGLEAGKQLQSAYWQAKYGIWTAGIYTAATQFDSAKKYFELSYPLVVQLGNDSLLAQYYQNLGTLYMYQNLNDLAAENMIQSVTIMEQMKEPAPASVLMSAYMNLSGLFNSMGQADKALQYDRKTIKSKSILVDSAEYSAMFFNFTVTCLGLADYACMQLYLDSASYYEQRFPNPRVRLNIMGGWGTYYERRNLEDSALQFYEQAMQLSKNIEDFYYFTEQAINAAKMYFKQKKITQSIALFKEAVTYALSFRDYKMIAESYKGLKEIEVYRGNFKAAYAYDELSDSYFDSLGKSDITNKILALEAKYENKKKETELSKLTLSVAENELLLVKRNRLLATVGISSVALLLMIGLLFRNSRQRQIITEKDRQLKIEQIGFLERQQQVVSLQSMINGQETERTRIAKDLHDGLGGLFSTIKMYFSTLIHDQNTLTENPLYHKCQELIDLASEEVRRIAHNMMPEVLLKIGLVQGTRELCASISAGKLLKVSFQSYGMDQRLHPSTEIMLYRILQELLNNIMKHAQATEALIQFNRVGSKLTITVEDNGKGFQLEETNVGNHAGLDSVQHRVHYLNGRMMIDSQKEIGTTVMMEFLLQESTSISE